MRIRFLLPLLFLASGYAQTPSQPEHVFLTHRKAWLATGGFNAIQSKPDKALQDYAKDFRKRCPKVTVTDSPKEADYAVTIDESFFSGSFVQVAVYSRNAGLIYMGGTATLKNAIKDACNAIGTDK